MATTTPFLCASRSTFLAFPSLVLVRYESTLSASSSRLSLHIPFGGFWMKVPRHILNSYNQFWFFSIARLLRVRQSLAMVTSFLCAPRRPRLYGFSGPVRFEDYIFGIRFLDITGYGDFGPVRFEVHIFIPISASLWRLEEYIFGMLFPAYPTIPTGAPSHLRQLAMVISSLSPSALEPLSLDLGSTAEESHADQAEELTAEELLTAHSRG